MIASIREIQDFASDRFEKAKEGASVIQFSVMEASKYSKSASLSPRSSLIGNHPDYSVIDNAFGIAAWAVILSVDLRKSSNLAHVIGPKDMYLVMHTFLPTMLQLVDKADALVVGLRGDGLVAAFGTTKQGTTVTSQISDSAIRGATSCGKAMIEAVTDVLNPLFAKHNMHNDLKIGVGVDVGDVVITRIGLGDANEVTAYGSPVNDACHFSDGNNQVIVSTQAKSLYPIGKNGKTTFSLRRGGYIVNFPRGSNELDRDTNPVTTAKPK